MTINVKQSVTAIAGPETSEEFKRFFAALPSEGVASLTGYIGINSKTNKPDFNVWSYAPRELGSPANERLYIQLLAAAMDSAGFDRANLSEAGRAKLERAAA